MNNFTFLKENQAYGRDMLDIFKIYGTKSAITDFSILLGGYVSYNYYLDEDDIPKQRTGYWWTKTPYDSEARYVSDYGGTNYVDITRRDGGGRPVIAYSEISKISSNKVRGENGILEVEYGEYPQTVVSREFGEILEDAYRKGTINKTGKKYTTDSVKYQDRDKPFKSTNHTEYEYNGKKYIRFIGNSNCDDQPLSDGRTAREYTTYWVSVEPIKWMIDEKTNIAISKKILFSGVQFNRKSNYRGEFNRTDIKEFMDKYFSNDIIPSASKEMTEEEKRQIEANKTKAEKRRNPYSFNFEEVSEEDIIKGAIESDIPVFLHGKSSEGKSARVKQIDPNCIILYLRNATPDSINGKSVYNSETGEMLDVKPAWLKKLEDICEKEPDKYHIVFFDEITNALPSIQGIAFNIVLDREVNGIWKLPKNARIVAAGNEMKDSLAANQLAEPLFNRFAHVYIHTTVSKWLEWASIHKIHPAIYAYIACKKEDALRSKYDGENPNADPRKWEMASKMLYATGQPEMLRALVGEEITREFCEFCNQRVITLEDVLKDNYNDRDLKMDISEIYATAMGLSQVDEENFEKVREFVLKLGAEPCAIFDSLWIHGNEARMEIVAEARLTKTRGGRRI